ncbi:hypothetical protein A4244_15210 [Bacillus badius]|nr:hypothetical protein A4244_15210 [Bacillus badius]OCS87339.1 hypothetical protein A6M11_15230 [Bacillus badius]
MRSKNAHLNLRCKSIHAANVVGVHTLYTANLSFAVFVSVNLHIKDKFLVLKKLAGNTQNWEGGK